MGAQDNKKMVNLVSRKRGIREEVSLAMEQVDRQFYMPLDYKQFSYENRAVPVLNKQTISQPSTVADMLDLLYIKPGQKILEVGACTGYSAAIMAELTGKEGHVYSLDIEEELVSYANMRQRHDNISFLCQDGVEGYERKAPYDRIIVSAGATRVPVALQHQLCEGGIMVIPLGKTLFELSLTKLVKRDDVVFKDQEKDLYSFVPFIGAVDSKPYK